MKILVCKRLVIVGVNTPEKKRKEIPFILYNEEEDGIIVRENILEPLSKDLLVKETDIKVLLLNKIHKASLEYDDIRIYKEQVTSLEQLFHRLMGEGFRSVFLLEDYTRIGMPFIFTYKFEKGGEKTSMRIFKESQLETVMDFMEKAYETSFSIGSVELKEEPLLDIMKKRGYREWHLYSPYYVILTNPSGRLPQYLLSKKRFEPHITTTPHQESALIFRTHKEAGEYALKHLDDFKQPTFDIVEVDGVGTCHVTHTDTLFFARD